MAFINLAIISWSAFILLYAYNNATAMLPAFFAVLFFMLHIIKDSKALRFKNNDVSVEDRDKTSDSKFKSPTSSSSSLSHSAAKTTITGGVNIEGDISFSGIAFILSEVDGNISSENGMIKIRGAGNVVCYFSRKKLIKDGVIICDGAAEEIKITIKGKIQAG